MSPSIQPLAELKVMKMKECLMLTPLIMQLWTLTCKCYKKHGGKTDAKIVSYVAKGMFEPCLMAWYQADQTQIDVLFLDGYLTELSQLVLEKKWAHDILETILSSSQVFIDWKIEIENLNAIFTTSAPKKALTRAKLKNQLQTNLNPDLRLNISLEPILAIDLTPWAIEIKEHNGCMWAKDACTQKLIETSATMHATCCSEKGLTLSTHWPTSKGKHLHSQPQ
jgi:hypothetical protein